MNRRLAAMGKEGVVHEASLAKFEDHLRELAGGMYDLPDYLDPTAQHLWPDPDRLRYRRALSELNAKALSSMDGASYRDLMRLFEMTTVTKKLRRIAEIDNHALARASTLIRPSWVAMTFMNYIYPEKWGIIPGEMDMGILEHECGGAINTVAMMMSAPVMAATFGPEDKHIWYRG
jgi:hypothetical protein